MYSTVNQVANIKWTLTAKRKMVNRKLKKGVKGNKKL